MNNKISSKIAFGIVGLAALFLIVLVIFGSAYSDKIFKDSVWQNHNFQIKKDKNYPEKSVACSMDAKLCPDGSSVERSGSNCEFAPCPEEKENSKSNPSPDEKNNSNLIQAEKCYQQISEAANNLDHPGMANPAAVFCTCMGGKLESVETAAGQDANCIVGGKTYSQWEYFRLMNPDNKSF
jgi:putative hemolysin